MLVRIDLWPVSDALESEQVTEKYGPLVDGRNQRNQDDDDGNDNDGDDKNGDVNDCDVETKSQGFQGRKKESSSRRTKKKFPSHFWIFG